MRSNKGELETRREKTNNAPSSDHEWTSLSAWATTKKKDCKRRSQEMAITRRDENEKECCWETWFLFIHNERDHCETGNCCLLWDKTGRDFWTWELVLGKFYLLQALVVKYPKIQSG